MTKSGGQEYVPAEELLREQIAGVRELMSGAWQAAPGLVRRLEAADVAPGDLREATDLLRFPVLRKSDLPKLQAADPPFGGLLAVPVERLRRVFASPGPIYEPEGEGPGYYRWERTMRAIGFAAGDVILNCFGYHLTPAAAMFEEGAHGIGCVVIPAGIGNSELQVAVAAHYRANGYIGLPSYLKVLLEQARKSDLRLSIAKALVLAEKLPESLRAEFQREHGIHVRQGYGTAEIGAIAYECEAARGFHLDPGVLVEIVDPVTGAPVEPGTPGEVVCTPLNPVYALLRFATGDLAALDTTPCPCGRTTHRLTAILGRVDQSTKVRGLFLHPAQLSDALTSFPAVERFRAAIVRERAMDDLIIEVAAAAPLSEASLKAIAARVKETTKLGARIVQLTPGSIPEGAPLIDDRRVWD
ncbi:MAG TPA: AMP-binding protein [bacterium]